MTSTAEPSTDAPVRLLGREMPYKYLVAIVYVAAMFIDILDVSIVNVALPSIGRELHTSAVEWIVLGYTLSLAVWIPTSGWLGDRIGTKKVFLTALGIFVTASALCGTAQNIEQLIGFRILQGVGGGMLTPVGVAMLYRAFPPVERAKAGMVLMVPTVAAPALGPLIGGALVAAVGWRWIFFINLPIGVAAFVLAATHLREHREPSARHFDLGGFVLSGAGLALVVFALSEGARSGWTSTEVVTTGVLGVVLLAAMVRYELGHPTPMLQLGLLRDRMFRNANLISVFSQGSFVGLIFLMPLYLQTLRGYSAWESGLTTFPQAAGVAIASQISGRLYHHVGPRRLISSGMFAAAVTIAMFMLLGLHTDLWWVRLMLLVRGLAMGMSFVPLQAASYARIAPADNGRASSIFATQRQMSISVGVALLATVLSGFTPLVGAIDDPARAMHGFRVAFAVAAGLAALGAVMALRIHDDDAAPTMRSRQ